MKTRILTCTLVNASSNETKYEIQFPTLCILHHVRLELCTLVALLPRRPVSHAGLLSGAVVAEDDESGAGENAGATGINITTAGITPAFDTDHVSTPTVTSAEPLGQTSFLADSTTNAPSPPAPTLYDRRRSAAGSSLRTSTANRPSLNILAANRNRMRKRAVSMSQAETPPILTQQQSGEFFKWNQMYEINFSIVAPNGSTRSVSPHLAQKTQWRKLSRDRGSSSASVHSSSSDEDDFLTRSSYRRSLTSSIPDYDDGNTVLTSLLFRVLGIASGLVITVRKLSDTEPFLAQREKLGDVVRLAISGHLRNQTPDAKSMLPLLNISTQLALEPEPQCHDAIDAYVQTSLAFQAGRKYVQSVEMLDRAKALLAAQLDRPGSDRVAIQKRMARVETLAAEILFINDCELHAVQRFSLASE